MNVNDTIHIIRYARYTGRATLVKKLTVTRVTPTGQLTLSDGSKWKPSRTGQEYIPIGDGGSYELTNDAEKVEKARKEVRQSNLSFKLSEVKWSQIDLEKLEAVAAVLGIE